MLLLNRSLTVREKVAGSHSCIGWEQLTQRIVEVVAEKPGPIVFLLWGKLAGQLGRGIDDGKHIVLCAPHPSPLSARLGFFEARPFRRANEALRLRGAKEIDWSL